jgi:methylglyoxal synthase
MVAHDGCKESLVEWASWNRELLGRFNLSATKNTGELVAEATGLRVRLLLSGPLGGDAQLAAMIAGRELDIVIFFWDPLAVQPHDSDVRSLIRLAVLHDIAIACNRRTADLLISSPLLHARVAAHPDRTRASA